MSKWTEPFCWSCYDGCMCYLEANHQGLHVCFGPGHEPQFWTTIDADEWWFNILHPTTKKGGSDEPV